MTEQVLDYDPVTFKRHPPKPGSDARQNDNYTRHTDGAETTRDYSRPHTIPKAEFEAVTGLDHAKECAAWKQRNDARKAAELKLYFELYPQFAPPEVAKDAAPQDPAEDAA
jgi:hypothetical protein